MRRRSREKSLLARDIAPLPSVRYPTRRIGSRLDLKSFCETYFPEKFALEWAICHLEVIRHLERIILKGGKLSVAMPRGYGKTSLFVAAAVWAILFGHRRYLLIVAANKGEAKKIIDAIKSALTNNSRLREDFPESVYPIWKLNGSALLARGQLYLGDLTEVGWTADEVIFPTIPGSRAAGSRISTVGITGAFRGKSTELKDGRTIRPDLVLIDDPQTDKSAKSPTTISKLEDVINKSIEGLVGPGQSLSIMMACTVIECDDLADRYLNRSINPLWNGLRFKMLERMPERMDLWNVYRDIRREDVDKATQFYRDNMTEMRRGALVSWEANFTADEIDALQHAMNRWADNEASFASECQNEPLRLDLGVVVVQAKTIRSRLNGLDQKMRPLEATQLTAFIDVHDDLLYFAVCAWAEDFTGYVIDYGTYPEQRRKIFSKNDSDLTTMPELANGSKKDAALLHGLMVLLKDLLAEVYDVEGDEDGGEVSRIDRIVVDSGFKPRIVENAIRLVNSSIVRPSLGKGVKASQNRMIDKKREAGVRVGKYWIEYKPSKRSCRTLMFDTNYWKCQVHDAFSVNPGDRGGMTLWGHEPERHRMFAEHLNAESAKFVESGENKVYEWTEIPARDNHLFDCMVGNMVAASYIGVKAIDEQATTPKHRRRRAIR